MAKTKKRPNFPSDTIGGGGLRAQVMPGGLGKATAPRRSLGQPRQGLGVPASRPRMSPVPERQMGGKGAALGFGEGGRFGKGGPGVGTGVPQAPPRGAGFTVAPAAIKSPSGFSMQAPAVGRPSQRVTPGTQRPGASSMPKRQTRYSA